MAARRSTARRGLAIESLESRALLTALAPGELFSNQDHGHGPADTHVEHAIRNAPQARHDIHLPRPDRDVSARNSLEGVRRPTNDRDLPSQHEDRRGARGLPPPPHTRHAPLRGDITDGLFAALAQPTLSAVTNAPVRSVPPSALLASPDLLTTTLTTRPAPAAFASSLPEPSLSLITTSLESAAIVTTIPLSGESQTQSTNSLSQPATFSFVPARSGTLNSTLDISSTASRSAQDAARFSASDSPVQLGASTSSTEASTASPETSETTVELPFGDQSRTDPFLEFAEQTDWSSDSNIATWATYKRHETLVALGKHFPDGLSAVWAGGWLDELSVEATAASDRMIDIGELYDTFYDVPLDEESHPAKLWEARAEETGDGKDAGEESGPSYVQSLDAYLRRLRFDEFAIPVEDDDDEDDLTQADEEADSDEPLAEFDEPLITDDSGMIEMSHEDNWSLPTHADAGSQTNASAEADRCPVEHGSYVKTDGGAARYQAFEIGSSLQPENSIAVEHLAEPPMDANER